MSLGLAYLLATVFAVLALWHIRWAFNGAHTDSATIPKRSDGTPVISPGPFACLVVAAGLAGFGYVCLAHVLVVPSFGLHSYSKILLLAIGAVFLARGIGDFRYVGLFRRVAGTDFARLDRRLFTPLCLALSLLLGLLAFRAAQ